MATGEAQVKGGVEQNLGPVRCGDHPKRALKSLKAAKNGGRNVLEVFRLNLIKAFPRSIFPN